MLPGPAETLAVFVIFCRVGAMIMLMPGTSSGRVPVRVRLFLALAISVGLSPLLAPGIVPQVSGIHPFNLLALIARELLFGGLIGLLARVYFLALQGLMSASAHAVGFGGIPGAAGDDGEPMPAFVTLISSAAVVLLFQTEQHWQLFRGLVASYDVAPPWRLFDPRLGLVELTDRLSATFFLTLRIASPFLIYALIVNLAIGIANKLTPQIPVYFIGLPFVLAGGLLLLYVAAGEMLRVFYIDFAIWLQRG